MRRLSNMNIGSDLVISHLEAQRNTIEFVPPDFFMRLAIGLMPNLASGRYEQRRNRCIRSFLGTNIGACVEL